MNRLVELHDLLGAVDRDLSRTLQQDPMYATVAVQLLGEALAGGELQCVSPGRLFPACSLKFPV
jgi:hypothetical protein